MTDKKFPGNAIFNTELFLKNGEIIDPDDVGVALNAVPHPVGISAPEYITWTPQEDITAYELARCIGLIGNGWLTSAHIPSGCERHFTVWRQGK